MIPINLPNVFTVLLDGKGGASFIEQTAFSSLGLAADSDAFAWQHMCRDDPDTEKLLQDCGLDHVVIEALTADETRPRCTVHENGILLNLRGINLNPGAEPEDMVSVRFWIEAKRIVGVWVRPLEAVRDLLDSIERNQAPVSPGDLVAKLALRLADRAEPAVSALNEHIDELEEFVLDPDVAMPRMDLSDVRRSAIILRRYLVPQRDALTTLEIEDLDWLHNRDRGRLREAAERILRLGEDLDAIRDRAQVVHDQIADKRAQQMNRQMLLLSVVAALFLPLGLLTGLLGINVGGIPGADYKWAFVIVCVILLAIAAALLLLFRRIGMFR